MVDQESESSRSLFVSLTNHMKRLVKSEIKMLYMGASKGGHWPQLQARASSSSSRFIGTKTIQQGPRRFKFRTNPILICIFFSSFFLKGKHGGLAQSRIRIDQYSRSVLVNPVLTGSGSGLDQFGPKPDYRWTYGARYQAPRMEMMAFPLPLF